jgi:hypothetical protein
MRGDAIRRLIFSKVFLECHSFGCASPELLKWLLAVLTLLFPAFLDADIVVAPYLQKPTKTTMTILWWTDSSAKKNFVSYGLKKPLKSVSASNQYVSTMGMWLHQATISGLNPETKYQYKVFSDGFQGEKCFFTTAPQKNSAFKFAVLGDGRTDDPTVLARHRRTAELALSIGAAFIIEAGDIVKNGSRKHWTRFLSQVLTSSGDDVSGLSVGSALPFFPVVGNHEIYSPKWRYDASESATMERYKTIFENFSNGSENPAWEERYYAFDYGPASFIILDANNDSRDDFDNHRYLTDGSTPDWSPGSQQYEWMVRQLVRARKSRKFTFVFFHPSPYSRGVHGSPKDPQSGYQLRALEPLFRKYGVDAVVTSHDHIVEHCLTGPKGFEKKMNVSDPKNLNWFVMGNSGEASRREAKNWRSWMSVGKGDAKICFSRFFYPWAGSDELTSFLLASVSKDDSGVWRAVFEFVRSDGARFDRTEIISKRASNVGSSAGDSRMRGK